jgi:ABC-type transport system involved in multi-copper enzyme maturation permease subunit
MPGGGPEMAYLGKVIFASVILIGLFLVAFITPAFTVGAICGERERKTYEVLRTTLLPARRLVFGKLLSALVYMALLILAAVPLESLAFMLGGVVVEELVLAQVVLLVTAFAFASCGLFFSSVARTTLVSTVLSYGTVVLVTIGFPILIVIFASIGFDPIPYYGSTSLTIWQIALVYVFYGLLSASPITAAVFTEVALLESNSVWYYRHTIGSRSVLIPSGWITFTVLYVTLALVLLWITILRVRRQDAQ